MCVDTSQIEICLQTESWWMPQNSLIWFYCALFLHFIIVVPYKPYKINQI